MSEFKNIENINNNNADRIKDEIKGENKGRARSENKNNADKFAIEAAAVKPLKIFFTGGISSGKSKYAENTALSIFKNNLNLNENLNKSLNKRYLENSNILHFIATANSLSSDNEMKIKIAEHKAKRPDSFIIHENFDDLKTEIYNTYNSSSVLSRNNYIILIDSMTVWLSGIFTDLTRYDAALSVLNDLFDFIDKLDCFFIFVSDNLSFNLVPQDEYVRKFISLNGIMEQKISALCDFVYLTVAGNILRLK
jgi:adenosylcobinamide kinase/adenosylcobinamide-phosphate guanylyltransferase